MKTYTVECRWDPEVKVWYVHESDVPGLSCEAPTAEAMNKLLCELVPDLLRLNSPEIAEVPIELLVHREEKLVVRC